MLKADVFRPDGDGHFPVLINMGIYQKDKLWVPPDDLEEAPNPYMNWETVNPEWWVPRGYVCVRVDARGSGKSPGQSVLYSPQEAVDFYDAIEWAAHAALVQRPRRHHRHLVLRAHAMVGGESEAAVAEMHRAVGRRRRPIPRHPLSRRHLRQRLHRRLVHHAHGAPPARPRLRRTTPTRSRTTCCGGSCATASTAARSGASRRNGRTSTCRCGRSATGAAWGCTCAATPRAICAPHRSTRSCASTAARTSIRSTARTAGVISCVSSTIG